MLNKESLKTAYDKIREAKNVLVVTHDKPDGDALSSLGAMIEFLHQEGKSYSAFCLNMPPSHLSFLPHTEKVRTDRERLVFDSYDLIIIVDCGGINRTNLENELRNRRADQYVIEFDHHPQVDDYADLVIRNPEAAAAAEVIYDFFRYNKVEINRNMANSLLTGILTDTGDFLFPSTSAKTIRMASEMLSKGATFKTIVNHTWRNKSLNSMRLWGDAIDKLKVNRKYGIAYTIISSQDIADHNANDEELDGIINFISNATGIKAVMLLKEEPGRIKGSLRSIDPNLNVANLAKALGGGGHYKAAGFKVAGELKMVEGGWKIV